MEHYITNCKLCGQEICNISIISLHFDQETHLICNHPDVVDERWKAEQEFDRKYKEILNEKIKAQKEYPFTEPIQEDE